MNLREQLDAEMKDAYWLAGRATGYWGHYFLRSVRKHGGLEAAKRILRPRGSGTPQAGLQALMAAKRADLSVEGIVLQPRYAGLFTKAELAEARRRLDAIPRRAFPEPVSPDLPYPDELPSRRRFVEGGLKRVLVSAYERDPRARRACLRAQGLRCKVCNLLMTEQYGELGAGFIHVHHIESLSSGRGSRRVDPKKDLVPICPNCHAIIHRVDPPLLPQELKAKLMLASGERRRKPSIRNGRRLAES